MNEKFILPLLGVFGRKQCLYVLMAVPSYKRVYKYIYTLLKYLLFSILEISCVGKRVADQGLSLSLHRW